MMREVSSSPKSQRATGAAAPRSAEANEESSSSDRTRGSVFTGGAGCAETKAFPAPPPAAKDTQAPNQPRITRINTDEGALLSVLIRAIRGGSNFLPQKRLVQAAVDRDDLAGRLRQPLAHEEEIRFRL